MELKFITPKTAVSHPLMQKSFVCAQKIARAALMITGLGMYRAFINGCRVGSEYLTPGFNDYDAYLRYQTVDVTNLMKRDNVIEVWLGRGWYMSRLGPNSGDPYIWGDQFQLAARLEIEYVSGETDIIETDETWQAFQSPITMSEIYDGEHRDDTRPRGEPLPCVRILNRYHLEAPVSPPIREVAQLKPTVLTTPKGETVLDFGQNFTGIIRFMNRLKKGETLRLRTGEILQQGCFYRDNLLTALSEFRYTSDGTEKQVEPTFAFYGFRYACVESPVPVQAEDFTGVVLSSDLQCTLFAQTDHPALNRLMQNAFWSQRSNFLDVPTDCPQRDERLGWTGDTQVFVGTACYHMNCKAFYRKYMKDLWADQTLYYAGDIPMYSPSLRGLAGKGGAVWADAATLIPWNVYMHYGDVDLLRENYPMMREYVQTLIEADRRLGNSHIRFDAFTFGDWLAQDGIRENSVFGGTWPAFIQGVYYMHSVELTAKAAHILHKEEDAAELTALAEEIRGALMREYVTENGRLALDTQTAYILALRHHLYRSEEAVLTAFRDRLRRDLYGIRCGFTGAPLMLDTLLEHGMTEEAYRILLNEQFPSWLYEVNMGATTIWERWNSMLPDGTVSDTGMNSFNHYAYGSVCEAIYGRIMGLRVREPGWKSAWIAPQLSGRLRQAKIIFQSPIGEYGAEWKILEDGSVFLSASAPKGGKAYVFLPDHPEGLSEVLEGESKTWRYQPAKDYLHPFDGHSLILDLVTIPAAARVVSVHAPELYALAQDAKSDLASKRLDELSWGVPKKIKEQARNLMDLLPQISL